MVNDELFPELEVKINEQTKFNKNVYLRPGIEMKTNIGRDFHIKRAAQTASLFRLPGGKHTCSTWDRVTGSKYELIKVGDIIKRANREAVMCAECQYRNGITVTEIDNKTGNAKDVEYKCKANFAFILEHPDEGKDFVLANINFSVYRTFIEYKHMLESKNMTVDNVITKITKVDAPVGKRGNFYEFEFVEELDVNITEEEQKLLDEIQVSLEKEMTIDYVAGVLNDFAKVREVEMDLVRAKRLATSISDGQFVYPVKK